MILELSRSVGRSVEERSLLEEVGVGCEARPSVRSEVRPSVRCEVRSSERSAVHKAEQGEG